MKKHPLLKAAAAAGAAVLGAAYGVYRVGFYNKPTTQVPSPADMPTRECYRKAMGPDADALARDRFEPVHITAQDGTPLAARYYHHADGAPLAIIFHGYRGYATRDGLGGYTLCTATRSARRWATMCCCPTSAPTATAAGTPLRWASKSATMPGTGPSGRAVISGRRCRSS